MKKNSIYFIALFSITGLLMVHAQSEEPSEVKNMDQMVSALKLEKKQIEVILDKLTESGRISPEEAIVAKREIASLNDNDLENIKNVAVSEIKKKKKKSP